MGYLTRFSAGGSCRGPSPVENNEAACTREETIVLFPLQAGWKGCPTVLVKRAARDKGPPEEGQDNPQPVSLQKIAGTRG
jgi:hypothetical protein